MTDTPLDQAFSDEAEAEAKDVKPEAESQAEAVEPDKAEAADGQKEAEPDEQPGATDDKEESGPSPDDEKVTKGQLAATLAEREKRQKAEAEAAELRKQLASIEAEKSAPERPDELVDPDGARAFDQKKIEEQLFNNKVSTSIATARLVFDDFDEVVGWQEDGSMAAWQALTKKHPHLAVEAGQDASPGVFAYRAVKQHQQMEAIGNPEEFRTNLEKELRAKIEAEMKQPETADPELPESLAGEPSANVAGKPEEAGPTPLDKAFN